MFGFTATQQVVLEVEAQSSAAARKTAQQSVQTPSFSGATITRRVVRVTESD